MDFNFDPEDEEFRRQFRSWLENNLGDEERAAHSPDPLDEEGASWERRLHWHRKMHAAGWAGIGWPRQYGGRAASLTQQYIYSEELARARAPQLVNGIGILLVGPTLMQWGTEAQKHRHISRILSADEIWCQGYSEPNAGSDVASLATRAVEDGDFFVVNGQKVWTSDAHHADMCILLVRTDPSAPRHQGLSYLLVDMRSPGVTVRPLVQMTGDAGFNEVFFDNVRVPKDNLVGEKNKGWQVAITTLMFERSGIGTRADLVERVVELAKLARRPQRNGHGAWQDSAVRQQVTRLYAEATALKLTGFRQLTSRVKGLAPGPEGSLLKLAASELNLRINRLAVQLLGAYGQLVSGSPCAVEGGVWSYRMLAARGLTIAGGTSEIQRNIIGERVLGLPKG